MKLPKYDSDIPVSSPGKVHKGSDYFIRNLMQSLISHTYRTFHIKRIGQRCRILWPFVYYARVYLTIMDHWVICNACAGNIDVSVVDIVFYLNTGYYRRLLSLWIANGKTAMSRTPPGSMDYTEVAYLQSSPVQVILRYPIRTKTCSVAQLLKIRPHTAHDDKYLNML